MEEGDEDEDEDEDGDDSGDEDTEESEYGSEDFYFSAEEESPEGQDPRARVLSVLELENLFERMAPDLSGAFLIFSIYVVISKQILSVFDSDRKIPD